MDIHSTSKHHSKDKCRPTTLKSHQTPNKGSTSFAPKHIILSWYQTMGHACGLFLSLSLSLYFPWPYIRTFPHSFPTILTVTVKHSSLFLSLSHTDTYKHIKNPSNGFKDDQSWKANKAQVSHKKMAFIHQAALPSQKLRSFLYKRIRWCLKAGTSCCLRGKDSAAIPCKLWNHWPPSLSGAGGEVIRWIWWWSCGCLWGCAVWALALDAWQCWESVGVHGRACWVLHYLLTLTMVVIMVDSWLIL